MPCFHPQKAWVGPFDPRTGKCRTVFRRQDSPFEIERVVPCGHCVGCKASYTSGWVVRCSHEASMCDSTCFLTLTYDDEHLPVVVSKRTGEVRGTLLYRDFQLFMKRLRKVFGSGVRFYMCGEYGSKNGRPHYHAILFNCDFEDKVPWRKAGSGYLQYRSALLDRIWTLGHAEIGTVTPESISYVARYIHKKVYGPEAAFFYADIDPETGEVFAEVKSEFSQMSRGKGIGRAWFEKYYDSDVAPRDAVVLKGKTYKPPRYYDRLLEKRDPSAFAALKKKRIDSCNSADNTPDRLEVRERVALARLSRLPRTLD